MIAANLTPAHSFNVVGADESAQLQAQTMDMRNVEANDGGCGIK